MFIQIITIFAKKQTISILNNNNDTTKAMRKFCIYVKVKVNVFSETVALTFENVAQTTTLS
jgi:hypothetical protein